MDFLDMRTTLVGYALSAFLGAVMGFFLWRNNRARYNGLDLLFLSYVLHPIGLSFLILRGFVPDFLSFVLANLLILAAIVSLRRGLEAFLDVKTVVGRLDIPLLAFFTLIQGYFSLVHPDLNFRNLNIAVAGAVLFAECAFVLAKPSAAVPVHNRRGPFLICCAYVLHSLLRLVYYLFSKPVGNDFFAADGASVLVMLLYQALYLALLYALLLMLNRRLLSDTTDGYESKIYADRKLLEQQRKLDIALNASDMGVWHWDIKADKRYFNEQTCRILGLDYAGFGGTTSEFLNIVHPADIPGIREALRRTTDTGVPYESEYRIVLPGGQLRWVTSRGRLVRDASGAPWKIDGVLWDITRKKQSEADSIKNKEKFEAVFLAAANAITITDLSDGRIAEVNDAFTELSGYRRDEVIGKTTVQLGLWYSDADRNAMVAELMGKKRVRDRQFKYRKKNGDIFPCEFSADMVIIDGRNYAVSLLNDVSEKEKALDSLRESEARFRLVVESSPDAIFVQGDGKMLYVNPACVSLYGANDRGSLLGSDFMERIAPDFRDKVKARIRTQNERRSAAPLMEQEHLRMDGTPILVETTAVPVDFNGISAHMVFLRDITERKREERSFADMQRLKSLGAFAGGIAHDFNNLLTGIVGNLSLIKTASGISGDVAELTQEAENACLAAKGLARQLLTFASGGKPVKSVCELSALVADGVGFALRGSSVGKDFSGLKEKVFSEVDKDQMGQVIQNLAINAVQAMPNGGTLAAGLHTVRLGVGDVSGLAPGFYGRITVSDSGIGMSEDVMRKIFEPYFSTKGNGRGLGLAVCHSIIAKHGGQITVNSTPGKGTEFSVYLPLADAPAPCEQGDRPAEKLSRTAGRVLVMDDEEFVSKALKRMLESLGYTPIVVRNGEEALKTWKSEDEEGRPFDAAIMDLTISGGMGGEAAVKELKAEFPEAKVVVSSGYSEDPILSSFKEYGFDAVLAKPYKIEDLAAVLSTLFAK